MAGEAKRVDPLDGYEVGYRKPPAEHRFSKGRSGNPRGRPRKQSASLARRDLYDAVGRAARQPLRVTKNGRAYWTTQIEALAQQLTLKALQGDMRAAKLLVDTFKTLPPDDDPSRMTHEEWLEHAKKTQAWPTSIQVRFVDAPPRTDEP